MTEYCLTLTEDNGFAVDYSRAESGDVWRTNILKGRIAAEQDVPAGAARAITLEAALDEKMRTVFNIENLRSNQQGIMNAALAGRDVLVLMPTGGGKSLCYQLPAVADQPPAPEDASVDASTTATTNLTLVISPLKSLMRDQLRALVGCGVRAALLDSDTPRSDVDTIMNDIREGNYCQVLYVTPERLLSESFFNHIVETQRARGKIVRLVIDEAHCISQWGPNFRPEYSAIGRLRAALENVPVMMLTATASNDVQQDMVHQMGVARAGTVIFKSSNNRPNLRYSVEHKKEAFADAVGDIFTWICNHDYLTKPGIVYCLRRTDCEYVSQHLNYLYQRHLEKNGRGDGSSGGGGEAKAFSTFYHAGVRDRDGVQERWMREEVRVVCATIAFGMGIDKSNVRFVVHQTLPKSIEAYFQESGRAGRDGEVAHCALFYSTQDFLSVCSLIDSSLAANNRNRTQRGYDKVTKESIEKDKANLRKVLDFCKDTTTCRRVLQLRHFDEDFDPVLCHRTCDNCEAASNPRVGQKRKLYGNPIHDIFYPNKKS